MMSTLQTNSRVVRTLSRGRCLTTETDLNPGTLILMEDPIAAIHFYPEERGLSLREESLLRSAPADIEPCRLVLAVRVAKRLKVDSKLRTEFNTLCKRFIDERSREELFKSELVGCLLKESCLDVSDVLPILEVLDANGFAICDDELHCTGLGLYLCAATINHSCAPNACQTFIGDKLYVRTTSKIKVGEEITISYVDCAMPSRRRRAQLQSLYGFSCYCTRCCVASSASISEESLRCIFDGCRGRLWYDEITMQSDQYKCWIENSIEMSSTFSRHFPLDMTSIDGSLCLTCSLCPIHTITVDVLRPSLIEISTAMFTGRSSSCNPQERLRALTRAQELCSRLFVEGSYYDFEIASALCREYLFNEMYAKAEKLTKKLCSSAVALYSTINHPQVAVLLLQHAKLLSYVRGDHDKRTHDSFERARNVLQITHPSQHPLFRHFV